MKTGVKIKWTDLRRQVAQRMGVDVGRVTMRTSGPQPRWWVDGQPSPEAHQHAFDIVYGVALAGLEGT